MDEERTNAPAEESAPAEPEKSPREIALGELVDSLREQLTTTQDLVKELKTQNERLILSMPAQTTPGDDVLFAAFDKYNKLKR